MAALPENELNHFEPLNIIPAPSLPIPVPDQSSQVNYFFPIILVILYFLFQWISGFIRTTFFFVLKNY